MFWKKIRNILLLLIPIAALVLAAMPQALKMEFAQPMTDTVKTVHCSYLSELPITYGNLGPAVTVTMTALSLILSWVATGKQAGFYAYVVLSSGTAVLAAALPLLFDGMTAVGWTIVLLLLIHTVLSFFRRKSVI